MSYCFQSTSCILFLYFMCYFQDTYNRFFSCKSAKDRGTLYQVKQRFGHEHVKSSVKDNYNHAVDLLRFNTEGMTCLLAMKVMHTSGEKMLIYIKI